MRDNYHVLCREMGKMGWGSHAVLCLKHIDDPFFDRKGKPFCSATNLKQLDTYTLYEQMGKAPDFSDAPGEPVRFKFYEPRKSGSTLEYDFPAWIYREEGYVEFINREGKHMICALSDVDHKLTK